MRIVVTGSAGRIGSAIVRHLSLAHAVVGIDLAASATTHQVGDFRDRALAARA